MKQKETKLSRKQLEYKKQYEKDHYIQKLIKFKKEDYEKIKNILKENNITFTQYIMNKVREDLK